MNSVKKIWHDIKTGQNLELYLTVIVAFVTVVLSVIGYTPTSIISPLIMTILALIAVALIKIQHLLGRVKLSYSKSLLRELPQTWKVDLENSKDVWFIGMSLNWAYSSSNYALFQTKLKLGHTIHVLTLNPESEAVKLAVKQVFRPMSIEQYNSSIYDTLDFFSKLKKEYSENIEIKTIDKIFSFGFRAFNIDTPKGVIYSEHYPYKSADGTIPKIVIHASEGFWYNFFKEQILALWNNAEEWKVED